MLGLRTWAQVSGFTCLHIWDQKECLTLEYLASNFRKIKPCMALHVCFRVSKTWVLAERQKVQPPGVSWKQAFELGADGASPLASLEKKAFESGTNAPSSHLKVSLCFGNRHSPGVPWKRDFESVTDGGPPGAPWKRDFESRGRTPLNRLGGGHTPGVSQNKPLNREGTPPPPFAYLKSKPLNWRRFL